MLVLCKLWIGRLQTRGDYKAEKDRASNQAEQLHLNAPSHERANALGLRHRGCLDALAARAPAVGTTSSLSPTDGQRIEVRLVRRLTIQPEWKLHLTSGSYLLVIYTYLLEPKKPLCYKGYLGVGVRKGVRNPCSQPTCDIPRKWLNYAIKRV